MKFSSLLPGYRQWKVLPLTVGFLGLALLNPAIAQEKMMRTLTVTGRGVENVTTTKTQVRLGVEAQGKTAQAVQQEVAKRSSSVVALLRSRKVEKLETSGISLNPAYRYDNGKQTLIGYTASNIVSFRIDTQNVGNLLDDAVQAGATRIDGISFIASDEAIATARQQALREATEEAQAQAGVVLTALKLSPKEIVSIRVDGAYAPPPMPLERGNLVVQDAKIASTPIIGGEQEVVANVTLQISY
jgi:uncharacterized protein